MNKYFLDYIEKNNKILQQIDLKNLNKLFKEIKKIKLRRKKILVFGNGAGASIASHFANDLSKNTKIKCMSFDSSTHLTCYANDYGYENWVKETIKIYYDKNDLIILISASGNSNNMIEAAKFCNSKKISFFSLTGFNKKNKLKKSSKNDLWVNSSSYNQVEISQLIILLSIIDKLVLNK
jgi:D-sedoheptulose 7-phosphate isomerase